MKIKNIRVAALLSVLATMALSVAAAASEAGTLGMRW